MAPRRGRALMDRIIARVYNAVQKARSQEEHQVGSITLRLLGLVRSEEAPSLDVATQLAFGVSWVKFRERNLERQAMLSWELSRCVPDYDPAEAKHAAMVAAREIRRQATSGGAVYSWPEARQEGPSKQESVQRMPRASSK